MNSEDHVPPAAPTPLHLVLEACAQEMKPLIPRLAGVIKDREEDFLHLGATVFGINSQAGKFSGTASTMARSVGEGALQAAITELQDRADEARALFASVSPAEHLRGMTEVLRQIEKLTQAMQQFSTMVRTLKVLEITTRIESARLGHAGAGFTTLADDVKSLASKIVQNTDKIRDHTTQLHNQVTTAQKRGQKQLRDQDLQIKDMFAKLFEGIGELEQMQAGTATLVEELATGSLQVTKSMSQVISSVQFHDITRQQVEHVQEILEQAVEEITHGSGHADENGLGAWVRDVLRLQAPQLRQAKDMFSQAVDDLIASLDAIARSIDGLGRRITSVAYADQGREASILDTIRVHIAQVTAAMRATGEQVTETSRTMTRMAETISTVGAFVDDIEDIGTEIELIALNASVKAAHTGEQGRALGVLAVEIQHLSMQARAHTANVAATLNTIAETAQQMTLLAQSSDVENAVVRIQTTFEGVLERLASLDTDLRTNIAQLSDLGDTLVRELHALTSSIHVHNDVSKELFWLEDRLTILQEGFVPFHDTLESARQPDKLREQLARYTMESERLVHLAVLGHESPASPDGDVDLFGDDGVELFGSDETTDNGVELFDIPGSDSKPDTTEDDFGDNVELF